MQAHLITQHFDLQRSAAAAAMMHGGAGVVSFSELQTGEVNVVRGQEGEVGQALRGYAGHSCTWDPVFKSCNAGVRAKSQTMSDAS